MPEANPIAKDVHGTAYRRADGVVLRKTAGETLLIPVRGRIAQLQNVYVLDGVGEAVWEGLAEPRSLPALAASISARFRHPEPAVLSDCHDFLEELVAEGLVEKS